MSASTPDWVKNAVFYQIFPDRFARSPRMQCPPRAAFEAEAIWPDNSGEAPSVHADRLGLTLPARNGAVLMQEQ
jgi:hypothetical protein